MKYQALPDSVLTIEGIPQALFLVNTARLTTGDILDGFFLMSEKCEDEKNDLN